MGRSAKATSMLVIGPYTCALFVWSQREGRSFAPIQFRVPRQTKKCWNPSVCCGHLYACVCRYPTFSHLAGIDPHDNYTVGYPDIDGMNMWPYLTTGDAVREVCFRIQTICCNTNPRSRIVLARIVCWVVGHGVLFCVHRKVLEQRSCLGAKQLLRSEVVPLSTAVSSTFRESRRTETGTLLCCAVLCVALRCFAVLCFDLILVPTSTVGMRNTPSIFPAIACVCNNNLKV